LIPHVDTQDRIEQFLADTDPQFVNLCLDTGHIAYCDGDNVDIIRKFPSRITYVHLKQVDPEVRERVRADPPR
jgi:inosose dehydratase